MSYRDKTWQEIFAHELSVIEDEEILKILDNVFKEVLDCHKWLPASSSGKYHPKCDLGDGGLIRHSKIVFQFMEEIIRATPSLKYEEKELLAAALIHDLCKYKDENADHSSFTHPTDMAELIKKTNFRNERAYTIARLVSTHMGIWNTFKYYPGVELPKPANFDEIAVHYADYFASRQYLDFQFDDNGDLVTQRDFS